MGKKQAQCMDKANVLVERLSQRELFTFEETNSFNQFEPPNIRCPVRHFKSHEVPRSWHRWMLSLTRDNMKEHYDVCPGWGWSDRQKQRELTSPHAQFLMCILPAASVGDMAGGQDVQGKPCGFAHFRLEVEDNKPIVYLYEIQLTPEAQGKGLGRYMLQLLERMACGHGLMEIKLTVMDTNVGARKFYTSLGFVLSEESPNAPGVHSQDCGYSILVKECRRSV